MPFGRVGRWVAALPETAWTTLTARDGEKGPLVTEAVRRRVQARAGRNVGPQEVLLVTRAPGIPEYQTRLPPRVRPGRNESGGVRAGGKAAHEIEACFRRGKGHAGLGDYQVRNGMGRYHHQALSRIAAWFLSAETRRGEKAHRL